MSRKKKGSVSRGQKRGIRHHFCRTFTSSDLPSFSWAFRGKRAWTSRLKWLLATGVKDITSIPYKLTIFSPLIRS